MNAASPIGRTLIAALAASCLGAPFVARADDAIPPELEGIGIDERPGALLPRALAFRDQRGQTITLGKFVDGKTPFILVLAYYKCPMLCTMVLNGLTKGMKDLAWTAGANYRVVTVSIDPRDTVELARDKRQTHLDEYGRKDLADNAWDFLVGADGDPAQTARTVKTLADAIGFHYRWEESTKQFAHAAGAFVFTPDGRLSRTLYGIDFKPQQLRLALTEAAAGKQGSAWDKFLLFCYHYDPNARGYVLGAQRLMKIGGILTVVFLGFWLRALFRWTPPAKPTDKAGTSNKTTGIGVAAPLTPATKSPTE